MIIHKYFCLFFFILTFLIPLSARSLSNWNQVLVLHSSPLKPEEKFSTELGEVPVFLAKGKIFDYEFTKQYFQKLQKQENIIEIPIWAYGTWKGSKQVQDFALIYGEGSNYKPIELSIDVFDVIGDVESTDGKIYSIISAGHIQKVLRTDNLIEYQIMLKDERHLGIGHFLSRDFSLRVQVELDTGIIQKAFQVESEKIYKLNAENLLFTEGWLKSFDENGKPYMLSHGFSIKQLIGKHKLIDLNNLSLEKAQSFAF